MKTRIITGIVLVLVILPCVIIGQIPFQVLLALVAGAGIFVDVIANNNKIFSWRTN